MSNCNFDKVAKQVVYLWFQKETTQKSIKKVNVF